MKRLQRQLSAVHRARSRRRRLRIVLRQRQRQYAQHRPLLHRPEAARRAQRRAPRRSSTGCGRSSPRSKASICSCSRRRTSPSAAASRAASSSTRCRIPTCDELNTWAPQAAGQAQDAAANSPTSSSDQQSERAACCTITINRDAAARFGIQPQVIDDTLNDAFGQRQVTQYFTQTIPISSCSRCCPSCRSNVGTLDQIYVKAPATGQLVPLSTLVNVDTEHIGPLLGLAPGAVPGGDACRSTCRRASRSARRSTRSSRPQTRSACRSR